ncbi:hypothetical protein [Nonomuraea wenchangensis]|uniref:Uncharacterized protein n=1 Tax=Nonomuraea wenchangensis TaxID=568860 RepID=A0A1I0LT61_9ACTN|nr:hypothetical protein [Nonomuraea wenchangensis]SEU46095.1 hypothetical protein SAMN05421811_12697 [Nonomuraea wenchangensis]
MNHHDLIEAARSWAHGSYPMEAAVELLIHHGTWLRRPDFQALAVDLEEPFAVIDWQAAHDALTAGHLPCSGGEAAMLRIALSIAYALPVELSPALTCLDAINLGHVVAAVRHANGNRAAWIPVQGGPA